MRFNDFEVYLAGARALARGGDPYAAFFASNIPDYAFNQAYIYPPLLAWLLQPLAALPVLQADHLFLALLQLCLAALLVTLWRTLRAGDRQEMALGALLLIGFFPIRRDLWNDQVNLVLLLAGGLLALAYSRGDRAAGGVAFGAAVAVKLLQAPLVLLLAFGRRVRILAAAVATGAVLTAIAAPNLLPEYLGRVLPRLSGGTGFRENPSPFGFLERMAHPATFYTGGTPGSGLVRAIALLFGIGVVVVTWRALGRPRQSARGRALEMAAAVAALPLLSPAFHQLGFEAIPILILVSVGLARRDSRLLGAAAGAWLLMGVVHTAFLSAIGAGYTAELPLRIWAESQLLGVILLWLGCLEALRDDPEEAALDQEREQDHARRQNGDAVITSA